MDYKGYRAKIVICALLVTIALLAGGNMLFDATMVQRPLAARLDECDQIREYDTFARNGITIIVVRVGDVRDWPLFYRALGDDIRQVMGERPFQLEIEDSRDEVLTAAYRRMHYALQEAATNGSFVMMAEAVAHIGRQAQLDDHRLEVDNDYIFLDLRHGEHRLYEVIRRRSERGDA